MRDFPNKLETFKMMYDYLLTKELNPRIIINLKIPGCKLPREYYEADVDNIGSIWVELHPDATKDLVVTSETLEVMVTITAAIYHVIIPMDAVIGVFSGDELDAIGVQFGIDHSLEVNKPIKQTVNGRVLPKYLQIVK